MKYSYCRRFVMSSFLVLGMGIQSFHFNDHAPHAIKKVVLALDFDDTISRFNVTNWLWLFVRYPHRIVQLWFIEELWDDIRQCRRAGGLYDKDGTPIIGDLALVEYLISTYMPWASDQDKQYAYAAVTGVLPIDEVIDLVNGCALPIVVWTNNDKNAYEVKLKTINEQREQAERSILKPELVCTLSVTEDEKSKKLIRAKPDVAYYKQAYEDTCNHFNVQSGELLVLFIDDSLKNIVGAYNTVQRYHIPIHAIHFDGSHENLEGHLLPYIGKWSNPITL